MSSSGAQRGNKNASKGRRWLEALDKALKQFTSVELKIEAGHALDKIAAKVVEAALEGEWDAIQEIGNRLDGKPAQSIDMTGEITHVSELSTPQLFDLLERARAAGGDNPKAPRNGNGRSVRSVN